ncbi:MAG: RsmB/NOP family class I SAM-dependent RNA methyltransferase [Nanohaloarchaea archaeon]|nr:RsmB/NOP family class I SAM-dependent RNA methyltransferase [Candidatus Nanohaloarchaea archaeon]
MERYKTLIDDWKGFKEAVSKPALSAVRKNRIKARENFEEELRESFPEVEQANWNNEVFRLPETEKPGKSMLHWMGEYYVQEESAIVPVEVLDPRKGDKVLDMAAAPGGKTTQIASKLENKGKVIANDVSGQRMKSLHANIYRTGSACVAATNYDARNLPEDEEYNKILLDAPCSGEGDKARRNFTAADKGERESLSNLQKQLGEKAARMLEKDGKMVYSTCTLAPEENEEVVQHLVENTGLELENIELEAEHRRGVTSFQENEYGEEMRKTVRVYPHHQQSGVIYVAKFRK